MSASRRGRYTASEPLRRAAVTGPRPARRRVGTPPAHTVSTCRRDRSVRGEETDMRPKHLLRIAIILACVFAAAAVLATGPPPAPAADTVATAAAR